MTASSATREDAARRLAADALRVERDRSTAIEGAIRLGRAVEAAAGGRRFWFDRWAEDACRPWRDGAGNVYAVGELPYRLVLAEDQSPAPETLWPWTEADGREDEICQCGRIPGCLTGECDPR